jgi:hypothetical protein
MPVSLISFQCIPSSISEPGCMCKARIEMNIANRNLYTLLFLLYAQHHISCTSHLEVSQTIHTQLHTHLRPRPQASRRVISHISTKKTLIITSDVLGTALGTRFGGYYSDNVESSQWAHTRVQRTGNPMAISPRNRWARV